mmetsp:Transcript_18675/g.28227  ORF Transcript_18675/g.28227 Transcript_18675/m.28227 type:complete len:116 (+) Transcript_18675:559-906(+)
MHLIFNQKIELRRCRCCSNINIRAIQAVIMALLQQHEDEAFRIMLDNLDPGSRQEIISQLRAENISTLRKENAKIVACSVPNFLDEHLKEMLEERSTRKITAAFPATGTAIKNAS